MKTTKLLLAASGLLSLALAGCNLPTAHGPGPRSWIDEPLDGSSLPLGPIVVRSHAASDSGTLSVTLLVNGAQVRTDNAADPSSELIEIPQVWQPELPGEYVLQIVTMDTTGNEGRSNTILVRVGTVVNPAPIQEEQVAESQATATFTPAPVCQAPTVTFSMNANCREGPSTEYEVDASFLQGQSARIEGRNATDPRWWWVLKPAGGHCWVSASTGATACLVADVPVVTAPALPAADIPTDTPGAPPLPTKPSAPLGFGVSNKACDSSRYVVSLTWADSTGEAGYRVYRDGALIADLPANTTSHDDPSPSYSAHNYFVQSYNTAGFANGPIIASTGCVF